MDDSGFILISILSWICRYFVTKEGIWHKILEDVSRDLSSNMYCIAHTTAICCSHKPTLIGKVICSILYILFLALNASSLVPPYTRTNMIKWRGEKSINIDTYIILKQKTSCSLERAGMVILKQAANWFQRQRGLWKENPFINRRIAVPLLALEGSNALSSFSKNLKVRFWDEYGFCGENKELLLCYRG